MIGAQLRSELSKGGPDGVDLGKIKELCKSNPIGKCVLRVEVPLCTLDPGCIHLTQPDQPGCIVDNKMRSRVWMTLLLDGHSPDTLPNPTSLGGASSRMEAEDARVLDADVKRTR